MNVFTDTKEESLPALLNACNNCRSCNLAQFTNKKIIYRTNRACPPYDVLFVGEAPGSVEYIQGRPFVGPSGNLLAELLEDASNRAGYKPSYWITNAILCTPFTSRSLLDIDTPTTEQIKACSHNLLAAYKYTQPKKIVAVGRIAERALKHLKLPYTYIVHPSSILQSQHYYHDYNKALLPLVEVIKDISK